jgi:hypothetical protein
MGIDYNCYLGPYIQCKKEKVTEYRNIMSCTNPVCGKYGQYCGQKFCGNCGSEVSKVDVPDEVEKIDTWEVSQEIDEDLLPIHSDSWKGYDIWILNKKWIRKLHYDPKHEEAITEVNDTATELQQFKKDFAKQIEVIEKVYGAVEFKWGMILWMS